VSEKCVEEEEEENVDAVVAGEKRPAWHV